MKKIIDILGIFKPICDICKKDVETIGVRSDFNRMGIIVTVECHGESESFFYDYAFKELLTDSKIDKGFAFVRKNKIQHIQKMIGEK